LSIIFSENRLLPRIKSGAKFSDPSIANLTQPASLPCVNYFTDIDKFNLSIAHETVAVQRGDPPYQGNARRLARSCERSRANTARTC
jgi:hypothetical protein